MPSPLGRVAPKGPGEVQYNLTSIAALRRIRTAYQPLPTSLRSATFPKGEGFWRFCTEEKGRSPFGERQFKEEREEEAHSRNAMGSTLWSSFVTQKWT